MSTATTTISTIAASTEVSNIEKTTLSSPVTDTAKKAVFGSDLVDTFLVEAWEGLQQFEQATFRLSEGMDEATLQDIVMLSHRLRGSSGLYGYTQISQLCDMVERLAQAAPALDDSQHQQVQEFFNHVMVCLRGSLERIANGNTEGNVGLELARLGGSNLLLSLLSTATQKAKSQASAKVSKEPVNYEQVDVAANQGTEAISKLVAELELYRSNEQETLEYFLPEVKEHLDYIDQGFYDLAQANKNPDLNTPEIINQLFRSAHTLKGSAYMVELQFLGDVGHALEDIMIKVREEGMDFAVAEPVLRKGNKAVKDLVAILEGTQVEDYRFELETSLRDFQIALNGLFGLDFVTVYEGDVDLSKTVEEQKVVEQLTAESNAEPKNVEEKDSFVSVLVGELELYRSNEEETLEYFLPEVKENLDYIDEGFYELSQLDASLEFNDTDTINKLFRAAHTLKGSAYMVELQFLGDVGHALEDIMIKVREEGMDFAEAEPVLRKGSKVVKEIVGFLEGSQVDDFQHQFGKSLQEFQKALDTLLGLGAVIIYDDIIEDNQSNATLLQAQETSTTKQQLEKDFQLALDGLLGFDTSRNETVSAVAAEEALQAASEVASKASQAKQQDVAERKGQSNTTSQNKAKPVATIRASVQRLDAMLGSIGDLLASRTRVQNRLDSFSELTKQLESSRLRMQSVTKEFEKHYLTPQLESQKAESATQLGEAIIVSPSNLNATNQDASSDALHKTLNERFNELEFDSYSDINILAGSIAEMVNDLTEMQYQLDSLGFELNRDVSEIHSIGQSLRSQIGRVRMVAMTHLFGRLDRLLRQSKQDDDQDIFFETIGEQVEIDNAILEAVFDPIVQIVKNSKSHGIESRDERLSKGKPAQGRITVKASYQRNSVIITIKDDGKGIDLAGVKAKAIERELITANEAASLSDDDARQLIFSPGLSTAETLTSEAGRGVGMDIVASRIRSVKGTVQVESEKDVGTTFKLYLPLTLLISDILLVGVGRERFAVPTESIRAIENLPKDIMQLGMAGGQHEQPTIIYNEETIPIFHLAELLKVPTSNAQKDSNSFFTEGDHQLMLILETAGRQYALMLDNIFDLEEVIIKSLSKRLESIEFLLGATLSSYGDVVMLLDPQGLYQLGQERYMPQRKNVVTSNVSPVPSGTASDLAMQTAMQTDLTNVQNTQVTQELVQSPDSNETTDEFWYETETPITSAVPESANALVQNFEAYETQVQRLLLVDDSVSVRKVLGKKLKRMGFEVTTAHDGQDAFDILLKDSDFDALLTDLEMPRMNGYELIDAVRHRSNQTQNLPIIVMTTRARKEHVDLAKELGADDYLVKPVDEASLAQSLEQLIQG